MSVVNDLFRQAVFDGDDRQTHYNMLMKFKVLATEIETNYPAGEERSLSLKALHLAYMHAECAMRQKLKYKV